LPTRRSSDLLTLYLLLGKPQTFYQFYISQRLGSASGKRSGLSDDILLNKLNLLGQKADKQRQHHGTHQIYQRQTRMQAKSHDGNKYDAHQCSKQNINKTGNQFLTIGSGFEQYR